MFSLDVYMINRGVCQEKYEFMCILRGPPTSDFCPFYEKTQKKLGNRVFIPSKNPKKLGFCKPEIVIFDIEIYKKNTETEFSLYISR